MLIVDDVLATGGTAAATTALVRKLGGDVQALAFLVELEFLNGRSKVAERDGLQRPEILRMIALARRRRAGVCAVAHRRRAATAAARGGDSAAACDLCACGRGRPAGPEAAARLVSARASRAASCFPTRSRSSTRLRAERFHSRKEQLKAAHARWTADWLAWERAHDAEYSLKAAQVQDEIDRAQGQASPLSAHAPRCGRAAEARALSAALRGVHQDRQGARRIPALRQRGSSRASSRDE